MLTTVALINARNLFDADVTQQYLVAPDLVYADDTMLLSSSSAAAQAYLDAVTTVGRTYGLELNVDKTVLIRIRGEEDIMDLRLYI